MLYPNVLILFNRRKKASRTVKGGVDLEINFSGKQKFIATGVSLYLHEWNPTLKRCKGQNAVENNKKIDSLLEKARKILNEMVENNRVDINAVPAMLKAKSESVSFLDYLSERIKVKPVSETTRNKYVYWFGAFRKWGGMVFFHDVTEAKIMEFDRWLHSRDNVRPTKNGDKPVKTEKRKKYAQGTIHNYHKYLNSLITDAVNDGVLPYNPYIRYNIKIDKGEKDHVDYLTLQQLEKIQNLNYVGYMAEVKDLFLFQCYTGISYSDMYTITRDKCRDTSYGKLYTNTRVKSNVMFRVLLNDEAIAILDKYEWQLPVINNSKYNAWLKVIGQSIGEPQLHSHQARGAFATIAANKGLPLDILSKVLGHRDMRMTMHYASIYDETIAEGMSKL